MAIGSLIKGQEILRENIVGIGLQSGMTVTGAAQVDGSFETVAESIVAGTGGIALDMGTTELATMLDPRWKAKRADKMAAKAIKQFEFAENQVKKLSNQADDLAKKIASSVDDKLAKQAAKKVAKKLATANANLLAKIATKTILTRAASSAGSAAARFAATATVLGSAGPIGWAIEAASAVFQVTGMLLDMLWDPLKAYQNKDLKEMKDTVDLSLRKDALTRGFDYPLQVKPNVIPVTDEEKEEVKRLVKKYYDDNEIKTEYDIFKDTILYQQMGQLFRAREIALNPLHTNQRLLSNTGQNLAVLIAATVQRHRGNLQNAIDIDYKTYSPPKYRKITRWLEYNWQLLSSVCCCLIIIILLSSSIIGT